MKNSWHCCRKKAKGQGDGTGVDRDIPPQSWCWAHWAAPPPRAGHGITTAVTPVTPHRRLGTRIALLAGDAVPALVAPLTTAALRPLRGDTPGDGGMAAAPGRYRGSGPGGTWAVRGGVSRRRHFPVRGVAGLFEVNLILPLWFDSPGLVFMPEPLEHNGKTGRTLLNFWNSFKRGWHNELPDLVCTVSPEATII